MRLNPILLLAASLFSASAVHAKSPDDVADLVGARAPGARDAIARLCGCRRQQYLVECRYKGLRPGACVAGALFGHIANQGIGLWPIRWKNLRMPS